MHTFANSTNKQKLSGLSLSFTLPPTEYCILIKSEVFFIHNRPLNMKHVPSLTQGSDHIHHDVLMLSTHCVLRLLDTG